VTSCPTIQCKTRLLDQREATEVASCTESDGSANVLDLDTVGSDMAWTANVLDLDTVGSDMAWTAPDLVAVSCASTASEL